MTIALASCLHQRPDLFPECTSWQMIHWHVEKKQLKVCEIVETCGGIKCMRPISMQYIKDAEMPQWRAHWHDQNSALKMQNLTRRWLRWKRSTNTNNNLGKKQRETLKTLEWSTFKGDMNMPECHCDNDPIARIQPPSVHLLGRKRQPISSVITYHRCKMKKVSGYLYRLFTLASDTWGRCFWCQISLGNVVVEEGCRREYILSFTRGIPSPLLWEAAQG